jgi:hypothetical protein
VSGQVACAAAIASLPAMTPQRLRRLAAACPLGGDAGDPITDWVSLWRELRIGGRLVRAAAAPGLARRWALAARTLDVAEVVAQHEQAGVTVLPIGHRSGGTCRGVLARSAGTAGPAGGSRHRHAIGDPLRD